MEKLENNNLTPKWRNWKTIILLRNGKLENNNLTPKWRNWSSIISLQNGDIDEQESTPEMEILENNNIT